MENTKDQFKQLTVFIERLKKIGLDLKLAGNFPWIYIDTINGVKVTEKFEGNHGFTIGWYPGRVHQEFKFTDTKEIFKLIRKYKMKKEA